MYIPVEMYMEGTTSSCQLDIQLQRQTQQVSPKLEDENFDHNVPPSHQASEKLSSPLKISPKVSYPYVPSNHS